MKTFFLTTLLALSLAAKADTIDSLELALKSNEQIQEKIYIHTDNTCYFVGDTLWYKAYVLRADNLKPTNISKLLYVELLSPDGMLVERQHIVVADGGVSCGQFLLKDSLYSGYYELRAYTKWNLNFNVTSREYTFSDKRKFYNSSFCADFFRDFEGLYSRVLPVYERPKEEGDWSLRYMRHRPKQHLMKEKKTLLCSFYPEGGSLVEGVRSRVAYELTDNRGQAMALEGTLSASSLQGSGETVTKPVHEGRGVFEITPVAGEKRKVTFNCDGKSYTFSLPQPSQTGVVVNYDPLAKVVRLASKGVSPKALAVLCRGRLAHFQRIEETSAPIALPVESLPTGINELLVYDEGGRPLASRLFFVRRPPNPLKGGNSGEGLLIDLKAGSGETVGAVVDATQLSTLNSQLSTLKFSPFARLDINVQAEKVKGAFPKTLSLAIRDSRTDDPSYDDGNMLTDLLLSGDLKGFVASPAYYFAADDEEHVRNLDLLLMVQGWRRYKRIDKVRYLPEKGLTYEGQVLKLPSTIATLELDDLDGFDQKQSIADVMFTEMQTISGDVGNTDFNSDSETDSEADPELSADTNSDYDAESVATDKSGELHSVSRLKKTVYVEAELAVGGKTAGVVTQTDRNGRFRINLPAFYDSGILFVKAYSKADSLKKCLTSKSFDKHFLDAEAYPDFYVKQDMFFPIFSQPYSWYQVNAPNVEFVEDEDFDSGAIPGSKLAGSQTLQTVVVKSRRRGKRAIDYTKPAFVRDIYKLYNDVTDYGLSYGVFNALAFPQQVSTLLFGNMGRSRQFNIRAIADGASFYRNYTPTAGESDRNMSQTAMFNLLQLKRLLNVRAFTDYELRNDSCDVDEAYSADVTLVFEPVPDDGKRYVYRDRRYVFDGITYPEAFYNRSYKDVELCDPKDYRRTLYWNPNARLDEQGRFTDTFYNNSRETRLKVSAAGVNAEGVIYHFVN